MGEITEAPLARVLVVDAVGEDVPASLAALRALAATTGVRVLAVVSPKPGRQPGESPGPGSSAAPSASVRLREAGCVELAVRMYRGGSGGLLRADQTPSSAAAVASEGCVESLVLPAQPAPCYFLSPGGWYRQAGRSGPKAASARSAALPIVVVQACRASRSSR